MKLFKTMFPLYLFFCLSLMGIATAQDDNELTKDDFSQIFGDGPSERQAYKSMSKIVKEVSKELRELDKKMRRKAFEQQGYKFDEKKNEKKNVDSNVNDVDENEKVFDAKKLRQELNRKRREARNIHEQTRLRDQLKKRLIDISLKEGADFVRLTVVSGIMVELLTVSNMFNHGAIRISSGEDLYQLELNYLTPYSQRFRRFMNSKINAKLWPSIFGDDFDLETSVFEFSNIEKIQTIERKIFSNRGSHPVCLFNDGDNDNELESLNDYQICLKNYSQEFSNSEKFVFDYKSNNSYHFIDGALEACGLSRCFSLPKRLGQKLQKGVLE